MGQEMPGWVEELEKTLYPMAERLRENPVLWAGSPEVFTPEQFGYTPGKTATGFIQQAVDAAAERGGTVLLSEGTYVSGTAGAEVATAPIGTGASFTFPLNKNSASSNLARARAILAKKIKTYWDEDRQS